MRKLSNFWHVKTFSLTLLSVACFIQLVLQLACDRDGSSTHSSKTLSVPVTPPAPPTTPVIDEERERQEILQAIKDLGAKPVRDISNDSKVQEFLAKHKVYVTLTTSPLRISEIHYMLETLDLTHVEKVLVNLPRRYGRDNKEYSIPDDLLKNPKVKILRTPLDYGPLTKMVGAIGYARQQDRKALVISVDDDIGYARGMIDEFIYQSVHRDFPVLASSTGDFPDATKGWNLPRFPTRKQIDVNYDRKGNGYVDLVEGYGGICYPVDKVDIDFMKAITNSNKWCFASDDVTISFALAIDGIDRMTVHNNYFSREPEHLRPLPYGLREDALHHGGGLGGESFQNTQDVNMEKYQKCYESLVNISYDKEKRKFRSKREIMDGLHSESRAPWKKQDVHWKHAPDEDADEITPEEMEKLLPH